MKSAPKPPEFASYTPPGTAISPSESHDSVKAPPTVPGDPLTGDVCLWCGALLRVSEGHVCTLCRMDATRIERQMIEEKPMNPQLLEELRRIHELQAVLEQIESSLVTKGNRDKQGRMAAWVCVIAKAQAQAESMKLPAPTVVAPQAEMPLDNSKTA